MFIGALDDRYDLPALVRFMAQMCAALLMVAGADVSVTDLGRPFFGELVELGWLGVPFSIVIVLTAINAFNMFDGSDGVAGIQALIALVFLGFACIMGGAISYLPLVLGLGGRILGFLIFNWPSKRTRNVRLHGRCRQHDARLLARLAQHGGVAGTESRDQPRRRARARTSQACSLMRLGAAPSAPAGYKIETKKRT